MTDQTKELLRSVPDVTSGDAERLRSLISEVLPEATTQSGLCQAALLLGSPQLATVRARMQAPEGLSVVHETQHFRRETVRQRPEFDVEASLDVTPEAAHFAFRSLEQDAVLGEMMTRLRFVTPDTMRDLKGAAFSERLAGEGSVARALPEITSELVNRYVLLARDENPIHIDNAAAQRAGLSKAVVPGMMLCAFSEAAFTLESGEQAGDIKTRFMAAVPVGDSVQLVLCPRGKKENPWAQTRVFCVTTDNVIAAISDIKAFGA